MSATDYQWFCMISSALTVAFLFWCATGDKTGAGVHKGHIHDSKAEDE